MTDKDGNECCKLHSGIVQQISDFSFYAKLAMIVFVMIGIGVVGFLWHSQSKLDVAMVTNHKEVMGTLSDHTKADANARERMNTNINLLMWKAGVLPKDLVKVGPNHEENKK